MATSAGFAGLGFTYKPKTHQERPESENVVKKTSKMVPIEYPSSLEELLNRLFVKRLQYRIRPCLLMFAAHLVACKINIFVIRGSNIGANLVPSAHAENSIAYWYCLSYKVDIKLIVYTLASIWQYPFFVDTLKRYENIVNR